MSSTLERLLGLLGSRSGRTGQMLGGFVDSLLQSFENRRAGLSDDALRGGEKAVLPFFVELYEQEVPQLRDAVRQRELGLSDAAKLELAAKVDELVRKVVIPAYARLACRFTERERNDFYLVPESLHGLERLGWGAVGIGLGAFAVWAPFIPVWEKEWILPFVIVGLLFPNVRRFLSLRRYQSELNRIVGRADDEIWRMDLAYLTSGEGQAAAEAETAPPLPIPSAIEGRLASAERGEPQRDRSKDKLRGGGR